MLVDWAFICRDVGFPEDGFGVTAVNIGIREFSGPLLPMNVPQSHFVFHVVPDVDDDPGDHVIQCVHVAPDGDTALGQTFAFPVADNRPGARRQGATLVWMWTGLPLRVAGQHAVRVLGDGATLWEAPFFVSVDPSLPEVGCGY